MQEDRPGPPGLGAAAVQRRTLGSDPVDRRDDGETREDAARAGGQQSSVRAAGSTDGRYHRTQTRRLSPNQLLTVSPSCLAGLGGRDRAEPEQTGRVPDPLQAVLQLGQGETPV